jgi:amidase
MDLSVHGRRHPATVTPWALSGRSRSAYDRDMILPRTATALAAAVRAEQVTPQEAVAAALSRIDRWNPTLNAFCTVRDVAARAEAAQVAGRSDLHRLPLAGVPVAVKDLIPVAGEPMIAGSLATERGRQPKDHDLVTRLRAAGAVVVGSTSMPEAALWPVTDGADGITRNPWDHSVSAGGSSGGSAAAVAAGLVPIAHGSDGLGSIRIPAAVCGLVGIKPGRDVVQPWEESAQNWYGLSEHGALATTVDDAALLLAVLADRPDLAVPGDDVGGLRVGVTVNPPLPGVGVDRDVVLAVFRVAAALRTAGMRIQRQRLRYPVSTTWAGSVRWFAVAVPPVEAVAEPALLQPRSIRQARVGRVARRFVRSVDAETWRGRALDFFETTDVLLSPVLATGALPARPWSQRSWSANVTAALTSNGGFTPPWNLAGFPTVCVPAGPHPRTGLPIGVQLIGPPGGEARLLAVAAALEEQRPWQLQAPGYA